MMDCFGHAEQTKDKKLRYFTFRSDWDIEQLNTNGVFEVKENFNNSYIWDLADFYFKEGSVLWGFACEEDAEVSRSSYMGMTNLVEFEPDAVLVFTPNRHEMIRNSIEVMMETDSFNDMFKKCRDKEEIIRLEEKLLKYDLCMTDKFLEFCCTEKSYDGTYIIMFPRLKKDKIIEITETREEFKYPTNDIESDNTVEYTCSFCKDNGCPVCQLDDYLIE